MATILIVDDDASIRAVIVQALKSAGHQIFTAADGKEGLWHSLAVRPDLIITDLFMPIQEGLELIKELRGQFPHIAILAISGTSVASRAMLAVALELGATTTLEKPFDKETLLSMVSKTLQIQPPRAGFQNEPGPILPEND
ncbi:MAG TPA: response regulator [Verrucomicrobiae bacterium]|nr:response regulator [Verrucomicrobiae bacterium]